MMGLREEFDAMEEAREMGCLREYLDGTMSDEDRVTLRDRLNVAPTDPSTAPTSDLYQFIKARGD